MSGLVSYEPSRLKIVRGVNGGSCKLRRLRILPILHQRMSSVEKK